MNIKNAIQAVDTHTAGMSTRVIISGVPALKGTTMMEKKNYFLSHYDHLRSACMLEPRGHENMFGALITEPCDPTCDYGMLFMDAEGCLNMCGHGTIGVSTALVELGMVPVMEPITNIRLEAPAGPVDVTVKVENGRAVEVSFRNVPAFLYREKAVVTVPQLGRVTVDISFGGSFFALVHKEELGIEEISADRLSVIVPRALELRKCVNEQMVVRHPEVPIEGVDLVEIYGPPKASDADVQNVVVFGHGEVDRSPCGTGTCAKIAALVKEGKLELGKELVHESILGTKFRARALRNVKVNEFDAIIPEITGSAYVTGFNTLFLDEQDPFKAGFVL